MMDVGMFSLFAFIPFLIYLFIIGLSIYFIIKVIKFMSEKTKLDQQRNDKLDTLIEVLRTSKSE